MEIDAESAAELISDIEECVATVSVSQSLAGLSGSDHSVRSKQCRRAFTQLSDVASDSILGCGVMSMCRHVPLLRVVAKVSVLL